MFANYHTHTYRCRHAKGEDREYVERAIQNGIKELGFSDHVPYIFPEEWHYYSTFRMRPEETEGYVNSIRSLQKEYKDDIKIYLGFEAEYYPVLFRKLMDFLRPFQIDYLIMGQHYGWQEYKRNAFHERTDNPGDIIHYVNQVFEGLDTGCFTYVAHPDVIHFVGDNAVYEREMRRLCRGLVKRNIPGEINLLGIREGRYYPTEAFWKIAGEEGLPALIGCDAHEPQHLPDPVSEVKAREIAKRYNIRILDRIPLKNPNK